MAVGTFLGQLAAGVSTAAIIDITPNQLRAKVSSILYLLVNIIGIGGGAFFIGFLSDTFFTADDGIRYSLAVSAAVIAPLVVIILLWGIKHYRQAVAEAMEWE
jgi:MFS family permease